MALIRAWIPLFVSERELPWIQLHLSGLEGQASTLPLSFVLGKELWNQLRWFASGKDRTPHLWSASGRDLHLSRLHISDSARELWKILFTQGWIFLHKKYSNHSILDLAVTDLAQVNKIFCFVSDAQPQRRWLRTKNNKVNDYDQPPKPIFQDLLK